jgi:fumarate hydratase class II
MSTFLCLPRIGKDNAVAFAGSQGNFELNAMRPLIINNVLHTARMLGDACLTFRAHGIEGITLDRSRIDKFVGESLMLVTALSPVIGYDKASAIAHQALDQNMTLRDAAVQSGFVSAEEFDRIVAPQHMVGNPHHDLGIV